MAGDKGRSAHGLKKQVKMGLKQTGKGQRAVGNGTKRFKEGRNLRSLREGRCHLRRVRMYQQN